MSEYYKLQSTYTVLLKFSTNTRPLRIEIYRNIENSKKYRARVWDQNTYNLYPTFANFGNDGGVDNRLMSSDTIDREITILLSDDPDDLYFGREWESEEDYLNYLKGLVSKYHETFK